jgi:hypothetical protein
MPLSGDSSFRPRTGLPRGVYAERPILERGSVEASLGAWTQLVRGALWRLSRQGLGERLVAEAEVFEGRSDAWLRAYVDTLKLQLARTTTPGTDLMTRAVALCSEFSARNLGRRPSGEEQKVALAMLDHRIAAHGVDCDRGMSLILASAVAGLGGVRVHVISAREHRCMELAERAQPLLQALGLSSKLVEQQASLELRKAAWSKDVVFVSVSVLVDEFLKDRRAVDGLRGRASRLVAKVAGVKAGAPDLRLQGLHLALLDDASSLLCDFATMPYVLKDREGYEEDHRARDLAMKLARELEDNVDYRVDLEEMSVELSIRGEERLDAIQGIVSGPLARPLSRRRLVEMAVVAEKLYRLGQQYEVEGGKLEFRLEGGCVFGTDCAPDPKVKALLEVKEDLNPSASVKVGAHSTLRRVLLRYLSLGGATSSADGLKSEIGREFDVSVVHTGDPEESADHRYELCVTEDERADFMKQTFSQMSSSADGLWAICSNEESLNAMVELGGSVNFNFEEWASGSADLRSSHAISAKIGQEFPFGPEGGVLGPAQVMLSDCLEAKHIERQLLDRLRPKTVTHIVCLEDALVSSLIHSRILTGVIWLAEKLPRTRPLLAKAMASVLHSRAEAMRRAAREAYKKSESDEHQQLAFTGPPSA